MTRHITSRVGINGTNLPADVRTIQELLNNVPRANGGPKMPLIVDGICGEKTKSAIQEFQLHHLGWKLADGRVDPRGPTLAKLNEFAKKGGPAPPTQQDFLGCSTQQSNTIREDLKRAKHMLDVVLKRLGTSSILSSSVDLDTKQKVKRIFHINMLASDYADMPGESFKYTDLLAKYKQLRDSLDKQFPIRCESAGLYAAWVSPDTTDETVHFTPLHFQQTVADERAVTVIHERAHTVLKLPGNPHPGTAAIMINTAPDDENDLTYDNAIRNAYCYEWLTHALQPNYDPNRFRDRITAQHY